MNIHHIGVIVKNLNKSIDIFSSLGYDRHDEIIADQYQKNYVVLMESQFSPKLELIEPMNEFSSVFNFKEGFHHVCFEADPGEKIIEKFKAMKIGKIFTKPIIAPALDNREVVFACLQNGTFIEFIL